MNEIGAYSDFWAETGWAERSSAMSNGRGLKSYFKARQSKQSRPVRPRIIGLSSRLFIGSTIARIHQHSAGAHKAGFQEIGRSRRGLATKLRVAVDALGCPVRVILSAGLIVDIEQAQALVSDQPAKFVVASKAYD